VKQGYQFRLVAEVHVVGIQQWNSRVTLCFLGVLVQKWQKDSKTSKNSHSYLHVPGLTHGTHEAHPSPLGTCSSP